MGRALEIRRPPKGGAKRVLDLDSNPSFLNGKNPSKRRLDGPPPMPPTPAQNPPKIDENLDLPKGALFEPIWSPMETRRAL